MIILSFPVSKQSKANYQNSKTDNLRSAISIKQDGAVAAKGFDKNAGNCREPNKLYKSQARRICRDHVGEDDRKHQQCKEDFIELRWLAIIRPYVDCPGDSCGCAVGITT